MKFRSTPSKTLLALALTTAMSSAYATNGYFSHGYGVKAKGMGGAAVAMTHDAFAGANNPAAAAFAGNRWDAGVELFSPRRAASRSGSDFTAFGGMRGQLDGSVDSDKTMFVIPEFGYNLALSNDIGLNLTVYGNGGMNTEYPGGTFGCPPAGGANALCGAGRLGVNMMQLIVAPTLAYKVAPDHAIGVSPLFVYQQFESYGLQAFTQNPMWSVSSSSITNRGVDDSTGFGVRIGYLGKLSPMVSVGASYSPKVDMKEFSKYKGLFAGGGDFDIPQNSTIGFAVQASPALQVALDYQTIKYSGVSSVGNPSANFFTAQLGSTKGPGFGWQDVNVMKLGVQYQMDSTWTLRAGYNKGDNPIRAQDVTFNILAPGVVEDHYTLGATMAIDKTSEVSFFYMHAKEVKVTGGSMFGPLFSGNPASTAGGMETIKMYQNSIGLQYSKRF